jgi:hypothetical protein
MKRRPVDAVEFLLQKRIGRNPAVLEYLKNYLKKVRSSSGCSVRVEE